MKHILLTLFGILFLLVHVKSDCPNGCNPNSGAIAITYTPQCYGENYEYTISGAYDQVRYCDGNYYYYNINGTYQAGYNYSYDICVEFLSICYHSNPTISNDWTQCGVYNTPCVLCNTTTSENRHTGNIHIDSIPCNISVSATTQNCSDYKCSDGELTVSANTNACNGADVYVNSNYVHLNDGESHTFSGLPAGSYFIYAYSNPSGCTDTMTVVVEEPSCDVSSTFIVTPASGFACNDGAVEALGASSDCMQYYIWLFHTESSTTFWFWNDTRSQMSYYPNYNGDHFTASGLPSGHYKANLVSVDYACQSTYDLEITPGCETVQWTTHTDSTSHVCPLGVITSNVITNSCNGWRSELWTNEGRLLGYSLQLSSGDSMVYNSLPPDTFYLFTYINNYSYPVDSVCNDIDTIIIHPKPCVSPMTYSVQPALALDCSDGHINVTLQDSCQDWWMTILSSDSVVLFGANPYWWDMQYYWAINADGKRERDFVFTAGTYYIRNFKSAYDYDNHYYECETWDTLVIPCNDSTVDFTVQAFIQGYYSGSGLMRSPLERSAYFESDTLVLSLAESGYPYTTVLTTSAIQSLNGMATFKIPIFFLQQPYYIVLKHRNALETWSSSPVQLAVSGNYNFSNSPAQAYGNNQADLGDGNYGIWSGDLNQDGMINETDFAEMETATWNFYSGYVVPDITGDNNVESADYSLLENNMTLYLFVNRP